MFLAEREIAVAESPANVVPVFWYLKCSRDPRWPWPLPSCVYLRTVEGSLALSLSIFHLLARQWSHKNNEIVPSLACPCSTSAPVLSLKAGT